MHTFDSSVLFFFFVREQVFFSSKLTQMLLIQFLLSYNIVIAITKRSKIQFSTQSKPILVPETVLFEKYL